MSTAISGQSGSGAVTVYTLPNDRALQLETIEFAVDTDGSGGVHRVRVTLIDAAIGAIATLDDLNEAAGGQSNIYTYGLGLNASACTLPDGINVTDALPWITLQPKAEIRVACVDNAGAVIAGDTIHDVNMYGSWQSAAGDGAPNPLIQPTEVAV